MINYDLVEEIAPVRGDFYQHVFTFLDQDDDSALDMEANGATYASTFLSREGTVITLTASVSGNQVTIEGTIPDTLADSIIGSKLWRWDLERTETGSVVTTVMGGFVEIKRDATGAP